MTIYGYARVSTRDQDLSTQVAELTAAGCAKVYREKESGAKTDRAELAMRRSRVLRASRSRRDTTSTSPASSLPMTFGTADGWRPT
jgi:DNA invertase Pin-like site-specific DNA recombinase